MMTSGRLPGQDDRSLVVELTAAALARAAPDELVVLDETAAEYFEDPEASLQQSAEDSPLGAGVSVLMLTPYLLAAANVVVPLLGGFIGEIAKGVAVDLTKEPLSAWVRRLFRRHPAEPPGPIALTGRQARSVRQAVLAQCARAGLPVETAALVADATVGSLHVRP